RAAAAELPMPSLVAVPPKRPCIEERDWLMSPPLPAERNSTEPVLLRPKSLGVLGRLMFVAAALGMTALLGVARLVEPDLRGYGTHEQLGLPPCTFRLLTGIACPSCGMTTS